MTIDPEGRQQGRGTYVHRDPACVEAAVRRGGFSRTLRLPLPADDLATLRNEIDKELQ